MSTLDFFLSTYEFNRGRTLALLDAIEQQPSPPAVLGWRPGPGRAHIGWQLLHIGISEEIFATERLAQSKTPAWPDLVPRFRGGSQPDDLVPAPELIRQVLADSRQHLLETLADYSEDRLAEIPPGLRERGLSVRNALAILAWHEPHHHGQAHITLNLYRASHA